MGGAKRHVTADLKQQGGLELVKKLVATADIFVENFRPGVAERLGLGFAALSALNGWQRSGRLRSSPPRGPGARLARRQGPVVQAERVSVGRMLSLLRKPVATRVEDAPVGVVGRAPGAAPEERAARGSQEEGGSPLHRFSGRVL